MHKDTTSRKTKFTSQGFVEGRQTPLNENEIQKSAKGKLLIFNARNDGAPEGLESLVHRSPEDSAGRIILLCRFSNTSGKP